MRRTALPIAAPRVGIVRVPHAAAPSRFANSAVTRSAVARSAAGALLVAGGLAAFYASGTACSVAGLDWAVGGMASGVGLALLALPYGRLYAGVPGCRA